ncbi:MAG: hypothetical protein WC551_08720 [Patescibacteria group bacterium]
MQQLLFIGEWTKGGATGLIPRALPCAVERKPDRVWTLYCNPAAPPNLPFEPQHNVNAFYEDYMHDWNWRAGQFRYYSRVADRPVWVLLEYEDK